jgi:hypothetical protein
VASSGESGAASRSLAARTAVKRVNEMITAETLKTLYPPKYKADEIRKNKELQTRKRGFDKADMTENVAQSDVKSYVL